MTSLKSLPLIDEDQVEKLLGFQELFDGLEDAFAKFSKGAEGGILQPVRSVLSIEKHHGFFGLMPAYSSEDNTLATKLLSWYPNNGSKGLPTHLAHVLLYDATTGILKAIIDGESVTATRTAVASAVATKHLANPNSKILAVLGAGVQGKSHWKALSQLYKFDEVRVWSRTKSSRDKFAAETGARACDTVEAATKGADIICTCTNSAEPVLFAEHVKDGAHVNAVGACRPNWQEIDPNLMKKAQVVTDSKEACLRESGDVILSKAEIYAEIGEIIAGHQSAPVDKTTVFKSLGMALEDMVAAKIVFDKLSELIKSL